MCFFHPPPLFARSPKKYFQTFKISGHFLKRIESFIKMNEPHSNDVLFGKGKGSYTHEGNVVFRKLVSTYKVSSIHYYLKFNFLILLTVNPII